MIARLLRRQWNGVRAALVNLWRGRGSVVVTVLAIAVAVTMTGIAVLLQQQIDLVKGAWYDRAQVTAYLCTRDSVSDTCNGEPDAARRDELESAIVATPGVQAVYFEDRVAAYDDFLERFGGTDIARTVTPDAIPESFRVDVVDGAQREALLVKLSALAGVELVQDQRKILAGFFDVVEKVRLGALGFAAAQTFAAAALVGSLLRMSLRQRRREVNIMNLIGTPPRTVRAPFLVESMIVTGLGALLAGCALVGIVDYAGPTLARAGGTGLAPLRSGDAIRVAAVLWAGSTVGTWCIGRVVLRRRAQQRS